MQGNGGEKRGVLLAERPSRLHIICGTKVSLSLSPSIKSSCLHVHLSYTHLYLAALLKVQTKLCSSSPP